MFRFFRKMRNSLLSENKFTRYFFYALGEIFLVVIGILIALQVNNWNENRKTKTFEKVILTQLKESLKRDLKVLNNNISQLKKSFKTSTWIIENYETSGEISNVIIDSIPGTMPYVAFPVDYAAYKQLESKGIDIISNKDLRIAITEYYENTTKWMVFSINKYEHEFKAINDEWLTENYHLIDSTSIFNWSPNNREFLITDKHTMDLIYNRRTFSNANFRQHQPIVNRISEIIDSINSELEKD